ncbi:hypothetical protein ACM792_26585 [Metapseudomonas otitidis]|uniref:hypothetical protein n=1 Tax=Metapseudomonas otitidis TaxID=319939 RepID=UPI0039FC5760
MIDNKSDRAKAVKHIRLAFLLIALVLTVLGYISAKTKKEPPPPREACFLLPKEKVCVKKEFRPMKMRHHELYTATSIYIYEDFGYMDADVYITRNSDKRDDIGRLIYNNLMTAKPKELYKTEETAESIIYKQTNLEPPYFAYIIKSKKDNQYIQYSCVFTLRCSIKGSYKGLLEVRVDFQHLGFRRGDATGALNSFNYLSDKIFRSSKR